MERDAKTPKTASRKRGVCPVLGENWFSVLESFPTLHLVYQAMGKKDKESFVLTPEELKQVRRERKKALKAASNEETEKLLKQQKKADKAAKKATKGECESVIEYASSRVKSFRPVFEIVCGRRQFSTSFQAVFNFDQNRPMWNAS